MEVPTTLIFALRNATLGGSPSPFINLNRQYPSLFLSFVIGMFSLKLSTILYTFFSKEDSGNSMVPGGVNVVISILSNFTYQINPNKVKSIILLSEANICLYFTANFAIKMVKDISELKKILIIRLSSMGDILLTTPLIRSLKKQNPAIQIDFVLKEEFY